MSNLKNTRRPEPVLDEAKVAGLVGGAATAILTVAVLLGLVTQEDVSTGAAVLVGVAGGVVTLINFVVPKWRAFKARKQVTPLTDPRTDTGARLVPATPAGGLPNSTI